MNATGIHQAGLTLTLCLLLAVGGCGSSTAPFPGDDTAATELELALQEGQMAVVTVFDKRQLRDGSGGSFANFRIPALTVSRSGTMLAFAEGRRVGSDHHKGPIVLRRSEDGGKHWQALQIIAQHGQDSLNNPTPVVLDSGRILLLYQRFPEDFHSRAIRHEGVDVVRPGTGGEGVQTNHLIYSDDDGLSWSRPVDITAATKRPAPVVANFTGPGPGLVLRWGPRAGRIVIPACDFVGEGASRVFSSYAVYSDDKGNSWQIGKHAPNPSGTSADETQMVELDGGRILMTVRHRGQRMLAYSEDGGESWSDLQPNAQLPDSGAMASVVRYQAPARQAVLFHTLSTARIKGRRSRGAIYISPDEGSNWPGYRVYHPGSFDYSSIALLPNGDIGVLAEFDYGVEGKFNLIRFVRLAPQWLLDAMP